MLNEEELKDAALLVFANKQDQPGAKGAGDISQALRLGELRDRNWSIMACSAVDGSGVTEGMDWLVVSSMQTPKVQSTCADQNSKPSLKTKMARKHTRVLKSPAFIGLTCLVTSQWAVHTNRQTIWQSLTLATAFIRRARVNCRLEQHVHTSKVYAIIRFNEYRCEIVLLGHEDGAHRSDHAGERRKLTR